MSKPRYLRLFAMAAVASTLALGGCVGLKRAIGLEKVSPDEFAVESRAPLTIPPDFDLRPPQPGAPRPQEASAASKAQGIVDNAGPGQPGKQEAGVLKFPGSAAVRGPGAGSQPGDQKLVTDLLQFNGPSAVVENRKTTPLQVY
jgi:hypothetical protein